MKKNRKSSNKSQLSTQKVLNQPNTIRFKPLIKKVLSVSPLFFEFFSIAITWFTLREMQIERDRAYQPNIVMQDTLLIVDTGLTEIDGESVEEIGYAFQTAVNPVNEEDNIIIENVCLADMYQQEYYIPIIVHNIGVGVCKKMSCTFDKKSCIQWMRDFESQNLLLVEEESNTFACTPINDGDYDTILAVDDLLVIDIDKATSAPTRSFNITVEDDVIWENALLPNGEQAYTICLPYNYTRFIRLILDYWTYENINENLSEFAPISIEIRFTDVQGKEYIQNMEIHFDFYGVSISESNSLQLEYMLHINEIYK